MVVGATLGAFAVLLGCATGLFFVYRRKRGSSTKNGERDTTGSAYSLTQTGATSPTRVLNPLAAALPGGEGGEAASMRILQLADAPPRGGRVAMPPTPARGSSFSSSSGAPSSSSSSTGPQRRLSAVGPGVLVSTNPFAAGTKAAAAAGVAAPVFPRSSGGGGHTKATSSTMGLLEGVDAADYPPSPSSSSSSPAVSSAAAAAAASARSASWRPRDVAIARTIAVGFNDGTAAQTPVGGGTVYEGGAAGGAGRGGGGPTAPAEGDEYDDVAGGGSGGV